MAEGTPDPATDVREEASAPSTPESKSQKKKDKVRSAWISFVGRIVAQLVGAAATVSLGLYVVQRYQAPAAVQPAAAQPSSGAEARPAAHRTRSPRAAGVSLAVLPLDDYSGQADQAYFVDGLTEAIIADLARLDGLRVISRTSSMHYKGASRPLPEIAAELDVDLIVEGSVVRSGSRVRVTVQLIDAASDEHLWSRSYDRAAGDVLGLQAELAKAIAAEVDVAVAPLQAQRFAARGSVAPETYDLYLRGREAAGRRTADSLREAVGLFERAVARDPSFALGYAGLADAYSLMGASIYAQVDARTVMPLARSAAEKALELDGDLAEAHLSLAAVRRRYDWDWRAADREFRRALELKPGDVTAHLWYGLYLAEQGRHDEAVTHARRAADLDPLSPLVHRGVGTVHFFGRRYEEARAAQGRALALDPFSARAALPIMYHEGYAFFPMRFETAVAIKLTP